MANTDRGSEFNDIIKTWEQNEKKKEEAAAGGAETGNENPSPSGNELDKIVQQEATEPDNENKQNRLLPGDRATVNDDETPESCDK